MWIGDGCESWFTGLGGGGVGVEDGLVGEMKMMG